MAVAGSSLVFDDAGSMPVPLRLHSATLTALAPGTRYYYALGGNDTVYSFVNAPVRDGGKVYAVFADMGASRAGNGRMQRGAQVRQRRRSVRAPLDPRSHACMQALTMP